MSDSTGKVGGPASNPIGEPNKEALKKGDDVVDFPEFSTLEEFKNFMHSIGRDDIYELFVQTMGMMISTEMQRSMRSMKKAMQEMKKSSDPQ